MTFKTCLFSFERGPLKMIYFRECFLALMSKETRWLSLNIDIVINSRRELPGEVLERPFSGIGVATF